MEQLSTIWDQVLTIMANEVAKPSFETWLKDCRASHIEGNTLFIQVPNEFTRDWVEARYAIALRKTLRHVADSEWELRFTIPGNTKSSHSHSQPAEVRKPEPVVEPHEKDPMSSVMNPKYTFDTFVVGNSNRFAHAASLAVAEAPAKAYNPLFLYGGVGLGKTHLMHAIGHYALESDSSVRVVYVTSETFTNDLINAIGRKSMMDFRSKYRSVDVLLIDDIQFVAGKESTQEEFFHTFNALYEANKQLIISSDRPPKEIPTLEERLRSRFEWGLTTDIQAPDLETRIAILRKKAQTEGVDVEPEVLAYIAKHIQSNIRELEGAFIRVVAFANLHNSGISLSLAEDSLRDILSSQKQKPITIDGIQQAVAGHYGIKPTEMRSKKRTRAIAFPRQVAMYLSRELTDFSLPKIGEEFGGRDHTTVIHACEKLQKDMKLDPSLQVTVKELIEHIQKH